MKPPKRQRRDVLSHAQDWSSLNLRWTLKEKRALLSALNTNREMAFEDLHQTVLPNRSPKEIEMFIRQMTLRNSSKQHTKEAPHLKAPIEVWLRTAEDLIGCTHDHSYLLADAFCSSWVKKELQDVKNEEECADWSAIEQYVAELLRGKTQLPTLSPLDSAVVLDIMESLVHKLTVQDASSHREYMQKKYELLKTKSKLNDGTIVTMAAYHALFADLEDEDPGTFLTGKSSLTSSDSTVPEVHSSFHEYTVGATADSQSREPFVLQPPAISVSQPTAYSVSQPPVQSVPSVSQSPLTLVSQSPEPSVSQPPISSVSQPPVPSTSSVTQSAGSTVSSSTSGSQSSVSSASSSSEPSLSHSGAPSVSQSPSLSVPLTVQNSTSYLSSEIPANYKRRPGRPKKGESPRKRLTKDYSLFSLNPFCIPGKMLRLPRKNVR